MEEGIYMVSAVAEVFNYLKEESSASRDEIMQHISNFSHKKGDRRTKLSMIVAASRAITIIEKNPMITEKEVIKQIMQDLPEIMNGIDTEI
jgi:hypothetical protein